jgi:hypothetical protein
VHEIQTNKKISNISRQEISRLESESNRTQSTSQFWLTTSNQTKRGREGQRPEKWNKWHEKEGARLAAKKRASDQVGITIPTFMTPKISAISTKGETKKNQAKKNRDPHDALERCGSRIPPSSRSQA